MFFVLISIFYSSELTYLSFVLVFSVPIQCNYICRVSSTLGDDKQFRKGHLIDGCDDTCWNSDDGQQQYTILKFKSLVDISEVQLQFQGGFSAKNVTFSVGIALPDDSKKIAFQTAASYDCENVNTIQSFPITATNIIAVKAVFHNFTDFYGRVILYHQKVYGSIVPVCDD